MSSLLSGKEIRFLDQDCAKVKEQTWRGSRCLEGRGSFEEISTIRCGGGPGRAAVQGQGQGGFPGGDHAALAALGGPACAAQGPTSQGRVVPGAGRLSAGTVAAGADPSHGGGFEINLDHRKLRTPGAKIFTVPSEALAVAVATEWDSQQDTIRPYTMHLTTLCNTALDNPTQRDKDQLIRAAVKFLDTDTIWYSVEIGSSTSILGPSIPARSPDREVLASHLASYSMWALQGIEFVVTQLKSIVLTLGLLDRHLTVEQAVLLSRLEEEYQIQKWGSIEWAHDYERQELRARTAAGTLFVHLCSESTTVKHKLLQASG
ncbi:ATP synthase mitochondrial F1 complex assembly factor 2-like protein [Camelus ferus]|nr:ATP synthase mitochondrial F1 complex assembly factor 2-like protein [Camelus ferus]